MLAYIVAVLTATILTTAAARFWKRCFEDADSAGPGLPASGTPATPEGTAGRPAESPPAPDAAPLLPGVRDVEPAADPPDEAPRAQDEPPEPAAPLGVRWSWRSHRPSGLEFLRVTVTNAGPNPVAVTRVRLRTSDELARHADPPGDPAASSDYAFELFRQDPAAAPPRTLEPGDSAEAYFPCRDVADWIYSVAESENLDRNECHLTPECVDGAGDSHPARRKVDYERWLRHGHGPSLREHLERNDAPSGGGDEA